MDGLDQILKYLEDEIEQLNQPDPYQDTMYYERKDGRLAALEDVRYEVLGIKERSGQ